MKGPEKLVKVRVAEEHQQGIGQGVGKEGIGRELLPASHWLGLALECGQRNDIFGL